MLFPLQITLLLNHPERQGSFGGVLSAGEQADVLLTAILGCNPHLVAALSAKRAERLVLNIRYGVKEDAVGFFGRPQDELLGARLAGYQPAREDNPQQ